MTSVHREVLFYLPLYLLTLDESGLPPPLQYNLRMSRPKKLVPNRSLITEFAKEIEVVEMNSAPPMIRGALRLKIFIQDPDDRTQRPASARN